MKITYLFHGLRKKRHPTEKEKKNKKKLIKNLDI